jgi:hypothetical protein
MTRLHDSLTVIDGLGISKWSRAVIPTSYMKLRAVNPQALPDEPHDRLRLWASEPRHPHHFRPE